MELLSQLEKIRLDYKSDLINVTDLKSVDDFRIKYLGRKGTVSSLFEQISEVPKEHKPVFGKELNILKKEIEDILLNFQDKFKFDKTKEQVIDLSLPGIKPAIGSRHLITRTLDEIKSIFYNLGFSLAEGPELESDYYNFSALNFPDDHPARDMQDTFFVGEKMLLRTHTSPVQIRVMEKYQPPIRVIAPGRVFRNEAINARSYCTFHQVEGFYVDHGVTFTELKGTLVHFAKAFYGSDIKYRFRPSFFPFTEPSAEMDISCIICKGKGCRVCKHSGWLEILGCGMIDPNVFASVNYDSEKFTGYAFGMGIERIALLKYDIDDIRLFYENNISFLKQFI